MTAFPQPPSTPPHNGHASSPLAQLPFDYIPVTVYREHDASKRQPAAFPGYLAKDHTGRAAPVSDVITVPSHTKKDNPEGLPSHHPQPQ